MALQIISVLLFTVFFSEALTLMCYDCTTPDLLGACTIPANCTIQSEQCSSMTIYDATVTSIKSCSALCGNWSINVGQTRMTSQCCDSDLCNNATLQDSPNKIMCYSCDDKNCSNTLACKGDERQCITVTAELVGNTTTTFKGCASKTVCDNHVLIQQVYQKANIKSVSCCGQHLCNCPESDSGSCAAAGTNASCPFPVHLRSVLGFIMILLVCECFL